MEYLSSLGKTQTAAVQRDADIGVAEAERDAGIRVRGALRENKTKQLKTSVLFWLITVTFGNHDTISNLSPFLFFLLRRLQEAECKKEMMDVKFLADTKMADSKRELEMQKASFNQEVNTKVC